MQPSLRRQRQDSPGNGPLGGGIDGAWPPLPAVVIEGGGVTGFVGGGAEGVCVGTIGPVPEFCAAIAATTDAGRADNVGSTFARRGAGMSLRFATIR